MIIDEEMRLTTSLQSPKGRPILLPKVQSSPNSPTLASKMFSIDNLGHSSQWARKERSTVWMAQAKMTSGQCREVQVTSASKSILSIAMKQICQRVMLLWRMAMISNYLLLLVQEIVPLQSQEKQSEHQWRSWRSSMAQEMQFHVFRVHEEIEQC